MYKKAIITILLAIVAMAGQAQTPKDSCSIPKDSLCQERTAKSDTKNCPLDKLFLLKANVTNKEESKRNLPKIALPKNDIYCPDEKAVLSIPLVLLGLWCMIKKRR